MTHAVRFCGVFLILLLASAGAVWAQPSHAPGSGLAFLGLAVHSEVHALPVSTIAHGRMLLWGSSDGDDNHDKDHDWDHDKDHDKDHHKGDHGPKPTPEPSTILSFGAALVIGGGVLLSRRLRRNK